MRISRHIAVALLACAAWLPSEAAPLSVRARLDSVQVLMGRLTTLRLEVTQPQARSGSFPMFDRAGAEGYVGVCGDSVELRTSFRRDTVQKGGGLIQINYEVPVQAFDSGLYQLPQFVYVSGHDTVRSNKVSLKVIPVPVAADAKISDFTPPVSPKGKLLDFLPDWVIDLWWLWISILLLIILFIIGMRRYRRQGALIKPKAEPNPYDVAMQRLDNLKRRQLWEQGMEKEYFTLLTDILREYLEKRFGINAMEMTTKEIIDSLSSNQEVKEKRGYMRDILDVADFVKFAKVRPLPEDNIAAFDNARRFVEETKPAEKPDDKDGEDTPVDPVANIRSGLDMPADKPKVTDKGKDMRKKGGAR